MMRIFNWMMVGLLTVTFGCGGGDKGSDKKEKSEADTDAQQMAKADEDSPKASGAPKISDDGLPPNEVVQKFLTSLCKGDKGTTELLLTDTAKQKTIEYDLTVAPPGNPKATFEVGGVRTVQGGVNVHSRWTEPNGQGGNISYNITWVMRKQAEGWRIVGFATEKEGELAFLNFEDPEQMMDIYESASEPETKTEIRQASNPGTVPR